MRYMKFIRETDETIILVDLDQVKSASGRMVLRWATRLAFEDRSEVEVRENKENIKRRRRKKRGVDHSSSGPVRPPVLTGTPQCNDCPVMHKSRPGYNSYRSCNDNNCRVLRELLAAQSDDG